ncbi:hypothetical protein EFA46_016000 (plasmid) [Halarchaeum sp. CBA1220]|uniref:hypothetical protein n=1 Tax=Halarchaeum sp. CBA1220 TaxID=1853682 RepID=UPI0015A383DE|nr:hypothetical protein [Halarchaeum sp. CBA1220]QLC35760.1 hypothetical protein EFA46_016000 [Halarchaeum sp. CBA1220]
MRDDAIDRAFEFLVDDDLEAFATVAIVDGDLRAISYSPLDDDIRRASDYGSVCELPRSSLLGKLLGDFAMLYGNDPADAATVAEHVATDHLGLDEETVKQVNATLREEADA